MRIFITSVLLLIAATVMPIHASPLDDARKAGQIKELSNGYVMAQGKVPANVKALVADVNKRRRAAYTRIAKKNGISVEQVAAESYAKRQNN